jgi:hypothetical protein
MVDPGEGQPRARRRRAGGDRARRLDRAGQGPQAVAGEGRADQALVGRAVGEIAVVVVGRQQLDHRRADVGRALDRGVEELIGVAHPGVGAAGLDERGPQIPHRAAEDDAGAMDLADVARPHVLGVHRVELAQRRVVAEEAAAHAAVAGDRGRKVVGQALGERAVEGADAGDDRVAVHRVTELVIDDVGQGRGVLAPRALGEEVDRGAVRERVALVVDVDPHRQGLVEERQVGREPAGVAPDQGGVGEGRDLGVEGAIGPRAPGQGAVGRQGRRERGRRAVGIGDVGHRDIGAGGPQGDVGRAGRRPGQPTVGVGLEGRAVDGDRHPRRRHGLARPRRVTIDDVEDDRAGRGRRGRLPDDDAAGRRVGPHPPRAVLAAVDVDGERDSIAEDRAVADQRQDGRDAGRGDGQRGRREAEVGGQRVPSQGRELGGALGGPRPGDRDAGQGLAADHEQAVALEAKADLAADHRQAAVVLGEPDRALAGRGVDVVGDQDEVLGPRPRGQHGDVGGQDRAGGGGGDRRVGARAGHVEAAAPQPRRHPGGRVPAPLGQAGQGGGEALPRGVAAIADRAVDGVGRGAERLGDPGGRPEGGRHVVADAGAIGRRGVGGPGQGEGGGQRQAGEHREIVAEDRAARA